MRERRTLGPVPGVYIPRWAVGLIVAFLLNAGAVVWGASSANTRLIEVERRIGELEAQNVRQSAQLLTLLKR